MKKVSRILIIEDERPIARAMQLKLTNSGFVVDVASDGKEGIELFENNQYDLIITDLIMPDINGFKVLKRIKELELKSCVIVMSNLGQRSDIKKAKELGAEEFFIKSDTPLNTIVEYINNIK